MVFVRSKFETRPMKVASSGCVSSTPTQDSQTSQSTTTARIEPVNAFQLPAVAKESARHWLDKETHKRTEPSLWATVDGKSSMLAWKFTRKHNPDPFSGLFEVGDRVEKDYNRQRSRTCLAEQKSLRHVSASARAFRLPRCLESICSVFVFGLLDFQNAHHHS